MRRDASHLLDAAVPLVVGIVVTAGVAVRGDPTSRPLALALGLSAAAVLLLRRGAPAAMLAVSGGLVLALVAVDHEAGAIAVIAPAAALYSLALTRGRIHLLVASAAAVSAVVVADIYLAGRDGVTLQTAAHVALVAVPLLAAEALRNRRSYISLLLEQLELAERTREEEAERRAEQERLRIARDLHDVVAHTLTTINVQAGVAGHLLDRDPGNARTALATIEAASHDALEELRAILGVLREPDGTSAPLEPVPTITGIGELLRHARDTGLDAELTIDGEQPLRVPDAVQLAAFRIVQESLTNARQHSPGAPAHVTLSFDPERVYVTIENRTGPRLNGYGNGDGRPGVGIVGMRERATALGGTLEAGPSPTGFRVVAELPYRRS
jgi:signal transduction histidine kinase